jgi:hypothetical protein
MESITILQLLVFSAVAYYIGHRSGRKEGYLKAYRTMPITVLEVSKELQLREVKNAERNPPTKKH